MACRETVPPRESAQGSLGEPQVQITKLGFDNPQISASIQTDRCGGVVATIHRWSSSRFLRHHARSNALVAALLVLSGCSLSYVDDDGTKHIYGLGYVKVEKAEPVFPEGATVTEVTTFGVALYRNQQNAGLAVGYNEEAVASLNGNACLATGFGPLQPLPLAEVLASITKSGAE